MPVNYGGWGFPLRTRLTLIAGFLLLAASQSALPQEYLLPNAPGKAELTGACESCHGIKTILKYKRSPRQWNEIVEEMIKEGASINDDQKKAIIAYLDAHLGQANDYIPQPPLLRGPGPGLTLALEAAETARNACRAKGLHTTTLVVDSAGTTVVLLTDDGVTPNTQLAAASKAATVLKYKESSGAVMKRMNSDPELVAETKDDPAVGEVLRGGLPITAKGELLGAIAVAGAQGPEDTDERCAQAGLDRIRTDLERTASGLR